MPFCGLNKLDKELNKSEKNLSKNSISIRIPLYFKTGPLDSFFAELKNPLLPKLFLYSGRVHPHDVAPPFSYIKLPTHTKPRKRHSL